MKLLLILLSFFIISTNLYANEKENRLRGVILERISQFITYDHSRKNFTICVFDDEDMKQSFEELYDDRKYKNLDIKVKNITSISEISKCDILYVSDKNKQTIKSIVEKKQAYTLLVTDDVDILDDNFMLALYLEGNKINFAINHKAIIDANLKINYRLLKVASKVINPVKK